MFAIAITLLALDLRAPELAGTPTPAGLASALGRQWPGYFAFALSFGTILVMWINHHRLLDQVKRADHTLLLLNGLLLLTITAVPFPTAVVSRYADTAAGPLAAAFYNAYFLLVAVAFNLLWRWMKRAGGPLRGEMGEGAVASINRRYRLGVPLYLAATLLSLPSAWLGLAANVALAVYFGIPYREPAAATRRPNG